MVDTIYSIGYSGFQLNDFLTTLEARKVSAVIDVRSRPFSAYFVDYNKETLERVLKKKGIYYRNYAREFGAQQDGKEYYSQDGYLDFSLFARSAPFLQGVDKLRNGMARDYTFALMCAEKQPIDCHRAILVSRAFSNLGYRVTHLLPGGVTISEDELHQQLLEKYYPERNQLTLFEAASDEDTLLKAAYKRRNAEIGYKMNEESA